MIPEAWPPKVRGYLESTRLFLPWPGGRTAVHRLRSEYYGRFVDYLKRFDAIFGIETRVGIIYSDMMRAEAVTVDGRSYIAYDQYFGQVINMLNRLLFYKADRVTAVVYFHKVCSQILSRYGFYSEAIYAANAYRVSRDKMDLAMSQQKASGHMHGLYTAIQELFVMLHEQAHVIFKEHPDMLEAARVQARYWLVAHREAKAADISDEALTASLTEEERAYMLKHRAELDENNKLSREFVQRIIEREDLVEEFCCDQIALINVLGMFSQGNYAAPGHKKGKYSKRDTVNALLLTFLNMRTLQALENLCALQPGGRFEERSETPMFEEGVYATFYNARLHRAKELCYEMLLDDDKELLETHALVSSLMDRHSDLVLGPAMSVMRSLLFDASLRPEMDETFRLLASRDSGDPGHQRTVTALLHLIPERPAPAGAPVMKRRVRKKKR